MARKPYTRESLERALVYHGVEYRAPVPGGATQLWSVGSGVGAQYIPEALVYAYVLGLADGERKYRASG